VAKGAITSKIKHAIKHKTTVAALISILFQLAANDGVPSRVVQVLQDLFYVLLHVLFYL